MNNFSQALSSTAKRRPNVNPFAQALADSEREKSLSSLPANNTNLFSDALSRTGGSFSDFNDSGDTTSFEDQQLAMEAQRKKEALRRKLHDQVNPVDVTDIYNAREQQVKREIEQIRGELKMLVVEVQDFHKEVELTLMTETVGPGQEGSYYRSFFRQLRSFIMLLRQKLSSARTWATQMNSKSQKKKYRQGLAIDGAGHEKTSTVQDMMHHERSSQYSGG